MGWKGAPRLKRYFLGRNQRQAAKAMNMDPSTLNNYLSGKRSPDPDTLARICTTLGLSADWLLGLPASAVRGDMASEGPPPPFDDPQHLRARVKELEEHLERIREAVEDWPELDGETHRRIG